MIHTLIKAGAVLTLGSVAFGGQALAASPLPFNGVTPLIIPVQDEENVEVWKDLRPDVNAPPAAVGKEGEAPERLRHGAAQGGRLGRGGE